MDPDACLERILDAVDNDDLREAAEAAGDLLGWLSKGGFYPSVTKETRQRLVHFLIETVREGTRC